MRRVRTLAGVLGVCLIGLVGTSARAAVSFDFVTDSSNYTVLPNGTATVQMYLRETLSAGSASQLTTQMGMSSIGIRALRTTSPTAPATITAAAVEPFYNTFGTNVVSNGGAQADINGNASFAVNDALSQIIVDSSTVRRVHYGQLTIQAGLIPLQTTTFTMSDIPPNPGSDDNLTFTGVNIDTLIAARTFTVSVLPEPASMGLLGFGGLILLRRVRRQPVKA
jgi:hypothetical protein